MKLTTVIRELILRALMATHGGVSPCTHEADDLELVHCNLAHCKCGQSFQIPCTHAMQCTKSYCKHRCWKPGDCEHANIVQLMPGFWQCADCKENRTAPTNG